MSSRNTGDFGPDVSAHYLGERGQEYFAWQGSGGDFAARILSHRFRDYIEPHHTVIDFGCGGGFLLNSLDCTRKIGIDANPYALNHARTLGIECYAAIDAIADSVADVVISNHALEHVSHPIGTLRALRTKLRPGGKLVLCVPIDNWRHQRRYDPSDRDHHLQTWTPQSLGNTLFEAGFEPLQIVSRIHAWPGRWTVAAYGRLGVHAFHWICFLYGLISGKGTEIIAVATNPEPRC
jgi:SAM-dependent methyltransferase